MVSGMRPGPLRCWDYRNTRWVIEQTQCLRDDRVRADAPGRFGYHEPCRSGASSWPRSWPLSDRSGASPPLPPTWPSVPRSPRNRVLEAVEAGALYRLASLDRPATLHDGEEVRRGRLPPLCLIPALMAVAFGGECRRRPYTDLIAPEGDHETPQPE